MSAQKENACIIGVSQNVAIEQLKDSLRRSASRLDASTKTYLTVTIKTFTVDLLGLKILMNYIKKLIAQWFIVASHNTNLCKGLCQSIHFWAEDTTLKNYVRI